MFDIVDQFLQRPDFMLVLVTILMMPVLMIISIFKKRRSATQILAEFLKDKSTAMTSQDHQRIVELIGQLEKPKSGTGEAKTQSSPTLLSKIVSDIDWDVAGLIGVGVTAVLLFAAVSGTVKEIPEQLFTGWFIILGFYFGKGTRATSTKE